MLPSPVARRINAERLVLLGWSRAILLQVAHPLVAAGVYEHSDFRGTDWATARRLRRTVRAMLSLTFGDEAERAAVLAGIRTIHQRIHGHLPEAVGPFPAGARYSAEDPSLVLWVHLTLLESLPMFYELLVAPLSAADHDAYCAESAWVAVALGARPEDVPRSRAALHAALERAYRSGEIAVGPHARALAARVLAPPFGPLGMPAASLNRLLTLGTLPDTVRSQYGFAWSSRKSTALKLTIPSLRFFRQIAPPLTATWRQASSPSH